MPLSFLTIIIMRIFNAFFTFNINIRMPNVYIPFNNSNMGLYSTVSHVVWKCGWHTFSSTSSEQK